MQHIINLYPIPTTITYQHTLLMQKGYYDAELINKRPELKTNDIKYNKKYNKLYRKKLKASKSVSPKKELM